MSGDGKVVCVTGASGYIASWVVKLLLHRGYTVNATVRDTHDPKKVGHLLEFEGANERLHLFKAELLEEGSFDSAISGCIGVFHTASPCLFNSKDPQVEIIDPAIKGTNNVLRSCAKFPSVKRVVLTSSLAAMVLNDRPITPETVVDESWWSDPEFCRKEKKFYALSKTLAEEAAWKFAKEKGIDLITILPGYTIGTLLQPTLNRSCAVVFNLIGAETYSDASYGWGNVKDVANAHIQAFEIPSASGRYCVINSDVHLSEVVKILRESYPTLPLPNKCAQEQAYVPSCKFNRQKVESLDLELIPIEISLKETIESFIEKQFIKL